jgi:hypothetical protein
MREQIRKRNERRRLFAEEYFVPLADSADVQIWKPHIKGAIIFFLNKLSYLSVKQNIRNAINETPCITNCP